MKHGRRITIIISCCVAILAIGTYVLLFGGDATAPASSVSQQSTMQSVPKGKSVAANQVAIQNYAFYPANITVPKGTTVTWTNSDPSTHSIVLDGSSQKVTSGVLNFGASYSYVFDHAGTFTYHCGEHNDEIGKVVVTD